MIIGGIILLTTLAAILSMWIALLASKQPLDNMLASMFPWPVACSSKGCITTTAWSKQHEAATTFAHITTKEEPSLTASLTTTIRSHLVKHAFLRSPVTTSDARRYREEILNIRDDATLRNTLNIPASEYDQRIVLPFLQQEALRAQHHVESTEELYAQLSSERPVILLLFRYRWYAEKGEAVPR